MLKHKNLSSWFPGPEQTLLWLQDLCKIKSTTIYKLNFINPHKKVDSHDFLTKNS